MVKELVNRKRAQQILQQEGQEAIVATTPEHILYVTGIPLRTTNWDMQIYALLPANPQKKTALVIPTNRLGVLAQKGIPDMDIYLYSPFFLEGSIDGVEVTEDVRVLIELLKNREIYDSPIAALMQALREREIEKQPIAVDEMRFGPKFLNQLTAQYEGAVSYGYQLLRQLRLVKSDIEIARLREVATLNEAAEMQMINMIQAGVHEKELAQHYRNFMVQNNATPAMVAVGGGPRSALPLIEEYFYEFQQGDLVRFDLCTQLNGYWGDTGRTAVLGEPSKWQLNTYNAVTKGWEMALSLMKPGMKLAEVFQETVKVVQESGIPHYKRQHVGHSIGLEIYDDMVISPNDHRIIEKGMVFCVEVPYYELGKGGFQIEDTIVITENGYEFLTCMKRDLFKV